MRGRVMLLAGLVALVALPPAPANAAKRLRAFDSCDALVRYAARHAPRVGRTDVLPAPAPQVDTGRETTTTGAEAVPSDASQTNVLEAGVDEPDVVKSDGTILFAVAEGRLHAIDARAATPRVVGSLALPAGSDHELLLHGGKLLVISRGEPEPIPLPRPVEPRPAEPRRAPPSVGSEIAPYQPRTILTEIDARDPASMGVLQTLTVDGSPVASRLTGASARVVVSSSPRGSIDPVARGKVAGWVPKATLKRSGRRAQTRRLVGCRAVRRPAAFAGAGMLSVLTIDLERGLPAVDADALMTDAETVYASPTSLYVATQRFDASPASTTSIHRFDTSRPDRTTYAASGSVPGHLLNQFAMSEHDGVLRAATTQDGDEQQSFVTTLREAEGRLAQVGQVGGIGRDERIYAVRFMGPVGYVVTFRQTDPLFTLDLSDPAAPRVVGELEILGYSAYLHPVGEGRLLGVGQDATAEGRLKGAQVSLFDVSDPAAPRRLAQRSLGARSSTEAEYDHHAFLWWAPTRLAVLPVTGAKSFALGLRVGDADIAEVGRIGDAGAPVGRTVVVGDRLFALTGTGVVVAALDTLAPQGRVDFPAD